MVDRWLERQEQVGGAMVGPGTSARVSSPPFTVFAFLKSFIQNPAWLLNGDKVTEVPAGCQ